MKKFISLILSLIIMSTTAFGAYSDALMNAFDKSYDVLSARQTSKISMQVNQPLEFLDTIPEFDDETDIDIRMIAESIMSSQSTINAAYEMSEDMKKMTLDASLEYDVPIALNDSFRLDAWTKIGMWLDYDLSDKDSPVFKVIFKIPFVKKYFVADMSDYYATHSDAMALLDKDALKDISKNAMKSLLEFAEIKKNRSTYTVKLTDEAAKDYILEVFRLSAEFVPDNEPELRYPFDEIISALETAFEKITIFGKNGLTMDITLNSAGNINVQNSQAHICMNLYDILEAFDQSTEGLEREKSFIDITLKSETEISNHNKAKVNLPELTDENSYRENLYSISNNDYYIYDNISANPVFRDNTIYYPLDEIAERCKFDVKVNNSKVTISTAFSPAIVTVDTQSGDLLKDETALTFDVPQALIENDKIYCTDAVLSLLNASAGIVRYDFDNDTFKFIIDYQIPSSDEVSTEEPDEIDEEPEYLEYSLYLDRFPYTKNGEIYMPVYEFLQTILPSGTFSFAENEISYTVTDENVFNISTVNAKSGNSFVSVNGSDMSLNGNVEFIDNILCVPLSFAESLGLSTETYGHHSSSYTTFSYSFFMYNPNYIAPEADEPPVVDEYVPEQLYFHFMSDQLPYVSENDMFMPAYDFIKAIIPEGTFAFTENGFEYTAPEWDNVFGIKKISVYNGDSFITVNDNKVSLSSPATNIDSIIRIPISFAGELGLEFFSIDVFDGSLTSYDMTIDNAEYTEKTADENYDYDEPYNNWFYRLFN